MKRALLIIDHGSRRAEANAMLEVVADMARARQPGLIVEAAHMELAEPSIEQAVARCVEQGAAVLIAHPYMLSPGRHATKDIPELVYAAAEKYPDLQVCVTEPLGVHDKMIDVILERAGIQA
jgi:sirohydrochlorin ferrochelatase